MIEFSRTKIKEIFKEGLQCLISEPKRYQGERAWRVELSEKVTLGRSSNMIV